MPVTQTQTQQLYTHGAEPKGVSQKRAKYRDEEQQAGALPSNIMFDRRVVRGNTYAARIMPPTATLHLKQSSKQSSGTMSPTKRGSIKARPIGTPEPIDGRQHMDVQTDGYLEELTDTVAEADTTTQTDAFLDRPPTPLFVPQKSGVDAATQIEQGELFDFDAEVEPLLEVLVGKTLEQALMEVAEEEELAAMRAHQEHFEAVRAAELVATQRMEAAERRKVEEKERRLAQERARKERERAVRQKVAASAFARGYLDGIVTRVFDGLADAGYFYDPVEREVEESFMPWLVDQAVAHLERGLLARRVVAALVEGALARKEQLEVELLCAVEAAEAAAAAAAAKAAEEQAAADAAQLAQIRAKATFILTGMEPQLVSPEQVEGVRKELTNKAGEEATAKWEAAKAAAGEEKRATLEAAAAAAAAEAEAARAAAEEAGQEPPAGPEPMSAEAMEAEVAAAAGAVVKPEAVEVTDADVLSALMEQGVVSKDAIVQGLTTQVLKEEEEEAAAQQQQEQQ